MYYIFLIIFPIFTQISSKKDQFIGQSQSLKSINNNHNVDLYPPSAPSIENIHGQASTSNGAIDDETLICNSIFDHCADNPQLLELFNKFFDSVKEKNAKLVEQSNYWQTNYWTLWCENYTAEKLISADQNGIVRLKNVSLDNDFMQFLLFGRMEGRKTIYLFQELKFQKYYFDDLLLHIAMTELPHLVMDLHVRLPNSFKCPDACFILSGFVDALSFRELFPHCATDEFMRRAENAKIKTIGHRSKQQSATSDDSDDEQGQMDNPWVGFLVENPNGTKFELKLHYSPSNYDKWSKMVIRQLADDDHQQAAKELDENAENYDVSS